MFLSDIELQMKASNFSRHSARARLMPICWCVLPVSCAVFLVWQERDFREQLALPPSLVTPPSATTAREPFQAAAVASVFGLSTDATPQPSAEPLTLQGSFVVSQGLSKALLGNAQGSRLYQVGERLPGGSVLRRVEARQVVLWNNGREELLTLLPSTSRFLQRVDPAVAAQPVIRSARYLRPLSGQSE
jgi:type II secretory pathway component PulC